LLLAVFIPAMLILLDDCTVLHAVHAAHKPQVLPSTQPEHNWTAYDRDVVHWLSLPSLGVRIFLNLGRRLAVVGVLCALLLSKLLLLAEMENGAYRQRLQHVLIKRGLRHCNYLILDIFGFCTFGVLPPALLSIPFPVHFAQFIHGRLV
jgi:hypothetical protein